VFLQKLLFILLFVFLTVLWSLSTRDYWGRGGIWDGFDSTDMTHRNLSGKIGDEEDSPL